ncbi:MAG: response regulator, partial [Alteromonadales bacterium]|nr:response regulator [Alteromonadales bacterium]
MLFWNTVKKVLVIDDDRTLLRRVSVHFKRYKGIETVVFDNATEGLEAASQLAPNLIILDWTLPDIQGIDLLATLKNDPKTRAIPVLMLTGHNKIGNIED